MASLDLLVRGLAAKVAPIRGGRACRSRPRPENATTTGRRADPARLPSAVRQRLRVRARDDRARGRVPCARLAAALTASRHERAQAIMTQHAHADAPARVQADVGMRPVSDQAVRQSSRAQHVGDQMGSESEQLIAALSVEHDIYAELARPRHQRLPKKQVRRGRRQAPAGDVGRARGPSIELGWVEGDPARATGACGAPSPRSARSRRWPDGSEKDASDRQSAAIGKAVGGEPCRHAGGVQAAAELHRRVL